MDSLKLLHLYSYRYMKNKFYATNGNHNSKTSNRYAKRKEKIIQLYYKRKPANCEREKE